MKQKMRAVLRISNGRQTVKTSITLDPELFRQAKMAADLAGYRFSFSGFVADTLRDRIQCQNKRTNPTAPQIA